VTLCVSGSGSLTTEREPPGLESVDDRMICLMRLILALSALLVIYVDPSEPDRFVAVTYAALVVYTLYSAALFFSAVRRSPLLPARFAHWIDVACFLVLVALSSGTNSVFFFFFFFAILVASFRRGFTTGLRVTLASALLFTVAGYATAPAGPNFELNRFLLRPIYLLVLGYMMAYWGGREIRLKRRLSLLREMGTLSNPRAGVGHTAASVLARLQAFYDADDCSLVLCDPRREGARLYRLARGERAESVRGERLPPKLEQLLLSLPDDLAVVHKGRPRLLPFLGAEDYALDLTRQSECTAERRREVASLAAKLGVESFISVPLNYRGKPAGRLYLSARRGVFDSSDVDLLMQVAEQLMPVIHNIRLLAQLASNAAEQERQRLARDIHDSVIQPYIGLQYKLAAVRNKLAEGRDVAADIERLFEMTADEVSGLRGFVRGLRSDGEREGGLLSAVRRFAARFAESYDLEVRVESDGEISVGAPLAAELIRIVHEGLSNVLKHTDATFSTITFERTGRSLRLRIENDDARNGDEPHAVGTSPRAAFTPRSITERAEELGGHVRVERGSGGHTTVQVEIPL
jgi:signal transduction histidine kinase